MKNSIFRNGMALLLAGALMFPVLHGDFQNLHTDAAANKARVSVHDPSIVKEGGTYYVFGSHIEAAKTTDLQNWTRFTNGYETPNNVIFDDLSQNLQKAFAWCGEDLEDCTGGFSVWAPDVFWDAEYQNPDGTNGAYLMYFCTSSTYIRSVICYATSKAIEGPYTFGDTLIYSGFTKDDQYVTSATKNVNKNYTSTNIDELIASGEVTMNDSWFNKNNYNNALFPNAIDPTIYTTPEGDMYMTYGSWSGGIFTLQIDPKTGKCIHPQTGTTSDGRMIDSYFGTKIAGGYTKSGEGPFIEYNSDTGYYYLWTTLGGLAAQGGYNMRVSRSTSPTGPFTDPSGNAAVIGANGNINDIGLKVMGNYQFSSLDTAYMACGHNSVLRDDDGKWYLFYHARFNNGTEWHEVRVHEMFFNEDGWPTVTPFEFGGDHLSEGGYEETDIVGDYEYINHGKATDGEVINYQNISLNADHTISGAVSGKWEQAIDSAAAVITVGDQRYSGYFIAAENEKGKKVMSFTAVGSNGQTVWGAQNNEFTGNERGEISDYANADAALVIAPDTVGESSKTLKLSGTELLSGVSYFITNKNSGMSLDLPNGNLDAGTNIQQWDFNKSWAQQWRLVAVDETYFRIVPLGDESKCITVAESSASDGANVELQDYSGADGQLFQFVKYGSYYGILSKCSEEKSVLDVFEWSKENGGNIAQYPYKEFDCQLWRIEPVRPSVSDGAYMLTDVISGETTAVTITQQADGNYTIDNGITSMENVTLRANRDGSYTLNEIVYVIEPQAAKPQTLIGDVNADGTFSMTDVVLLQKWMLAVPETHLADWKAGDLCEDERLDVFDLAMMKRRLLN